MGMSKIKKPMAASLIGLGFLMISGAALSKTPSTFEKSHPNVEKNVKSVVCGRAYKDDISKRDCSVIFNNGEEIKILSSNPDFVLQTKAVPTKNTGVEDLSPLSLHPTFMVLAQGLDRSREEKFNYVIKIFRGNYLKFEEDPFVAMVNVPVVSFKATMQYQNPPFYFELADFKPPASIFNQGDHQNFYWTTVHDIVYDAIAQAQKKPNQPAKKSAD